MAFESLSQLSVLNIEDFPREWLPLTYLYDPDLPLYPLQYFHLLDPDLAAGQRPAEHHRLFGFIHHINLASDVLEVTVATNKDLTDPKNAAYVPLLEETVRQRLGLGDPVRLADVTGALHSKLTDANELLRELWFQVVDKSFGGALPFGKLWDGTLGLVRFVASWFSEGGRKGELIQTHSFASEFGTRIATGPGIHVDFYLLPTFEELVDNKNPLSIFPAFATLIRAADEFVLRYCSTTSFGGMTFSSFQKKKLTKKKQLDTEAIVNAIDTASPMFRDALYRNYSAFDRGPMRSVISLMMLHDLRHKLWDPRHLTVALCAQMYPNLKGSYQSPKVIQLYAQQCFGCHVALPIDNWVATFVEWPMNFRPTKKNQFHVEIFACSDHWGKVERLIWMAGQARKVHSSVAANILWCVRFGGPKKKMRGANPLSCKVCEVHVRDRCPAYQAISNHQISFNGLAAVKPSFSVATSKHSNHVPGQTFLNCSFGKKIADEYTVRDKPLGFSLFPAPGHDGSAMTVKDFIDGY